MATYSIDEVECTSVGGIPSVEPVMCEVSWPHIIHCGFSGNVRVRWKDSGEAPSADELREWDAMWATRMSGPHVKVSP